jgi:glycosyltransferase involved in cell wall biosynthesis
MTSRILVMAHAHPDFSLGGGEIAAYNLYKAYRELPEVETAWFLARADRHRGLTGAISLRRKDEYLWEQAVFDWFLMKAAHQDSLINGFADLIRILKPTVIHTHHYAHFGLEYLRVIKQVDPSIQIVMTLHEYMAICHNQGQMIKTGTFKLCSRESNDECSRCFPEKTAEDFWLRKHFFIRHFDLVDQFIAPSEFLRQRYIDWGLRPERIAVIENGQSNDEPIAPRALSKGESRNRFGFFGQINPYKGLDILLQGLLDMPKANRKKIILEIHGANLEVQPKAFQEKIENLRKPLIKQGVVQWVGPYQQHELRQRMSCIDWVVVPSIWWENSPMVIQEAYVFGRPLLVSNIGGMKEKVIEGECGLHIQAGSSRSWADKMLHLAEDDNSDIFNRFMNHLKRPLTHSLIAKEHLNFFVK